MIDPDQAYARATAVETASFGGEQVVLDPDRRMLRGFNATGARVWELLDGRRTVRELARQLADETGADAAVAVADVVAVLAALDARGLLRKGGT